MPNKKRVLECKGRMPYKTLFFREDPADQKWNGIVLKPR